MKQIAVTFTVNDEKVTVTSDTNRSLLDVLRDDLALTGAKDGCGGEGECGACTVILNNNPVNACLVLIGQVTGCWVETIENLSAGGKLHPLQKAFVEAGAVQCGFCTPGAIMSAKALLERGARSGEEDIREAMSGNLCRCTGYVKMIDAVQLAAREMRK